MEIRERGVKLRTLTACRPKKFSIHIVEEELFFDSNVASLPIFVFIMCRLFTVDNLMKVVTMLMDLPEGGEVRGELGFRLRALLLGKAIVISDFIGSCQVDYVDGVAVERARPERDKDFVFSGFNDALINEVVYMKNHRHRVAGAVKMGRDVEAAMLVPLREVVSTHVCAGIFPTCRHFGHVFGMGVEGGGYDEWVANLVCPVLPRETYGDDDPGLLFVSGMEAGPGTQLEHLPFLQRWMRYLDDNPRVKRNWEGHVDYLGFRPVTVAIAEWDDPREVRYIRAPFQRWGPAVMRNPFMRADKMIQWSHLFVGEDGLERPFEEFNEGEMIRHRHENRCTVENQASAVVFDSCFFCHVCQKTYYVSSKLAADPYPFVETEIEKVNCFKAFLPSPGTIDWSTVLKTKYLAVSAPMGAGKSTWLEYLLRDGPFSEASVCVLTHRSLLALEIAASLV
jgi:hypothetical protein